MITFRNRLIHRVKFENFWKIGVILNTYVLSISNSVFSQWQFLAIVHNAIEKPNGLARYFWLPDTILTFIANTALMIW